VMKFLALALILAAVAVRGEVANPMDALQY
jgi:hypothetical protein